MSTKYFGRIGFITLLYALIGVQGSFSASFPESVKLKSQILANSKLVEYLGEEKIQYPSSSPYIDISRVMTREHIQYKTGAVAPELLRGSIEYLFCGKTLVERSVASPSFDGESCYVVEVKVQDSEKRPGGVTLAAQVTDYRKLDS